MKIKSFGCSFTFGSDLADCEYPYCSMSTWPALIAQKNNLDYECYARPGIGNLQIMNFVLEQAPLKDPAIFVINWTWIDRFDYLDPDCDRFVTLRPDGDQTQHKLYYKYFYNQYHTMLVNNAYIISTISLLQSLKVPFFMTAQDRTLIEPVNPNWQDPRSISFMQKNVYPYLHWFDGMSFLSWSRKNGYAESQHYHPLEQAHKLAADLMIGPFNEQFGDLCSKHT